MLSISAFAFSIDSLLVANIDINPVSSISILASELADISFITFPPWPITSLILSTATCILSKRGANSFTSFLATLISFAISESICNRPSFA